MKVSGMLGATMVAGAPDNAASSAPRSTLSDRAPLLRHELSLTRELARHFPRTGKLRMRRDTDSGSVPIR